MRTYIFSILYAVALAVLNYYHSGVLRALEGTLGKNTFRYFTQVVFLVFLVILLIRAIAAKKNVNVAGVLLSMGLVLFLLFARPVGEFRLAVLELFLLGILTAWEGRKTNSMAPLLLIIATAILVEFTSALGMGARFHYLDAWRNALVALSGFVAGRTGD